MISVHDKFQDLVSRIFLNFLPKYHFGHFYLMHPQEEVLPGGPKFSLAKNTLGIEHVCSDDEVSFWFGAFVVKCITHKYDSCIHTHMYEPGNGVVRIIPTSHFYQVFGEGMKGVSTKVDEKWGGGGGGGGGKKEKEGDEERGKEIEG